MADTPSQPPGWPYNQDPNAVPAPPASPPGPAYEPPVPPSQPPAPVGVPPYQPPPQPAAPGHAPYEPAAPGAYVPPPQPSVGGPGQPPPPQGWSPPPAPVKKSRRSLWITLAVIFGVVLLAIGACTVWFVSTVTAPVDRSNEFLAAIDRADYAAAIALSDPLCSRGMSEADLATAFQGADIGYNLNNSSITNSSATVSGSFSVAGENLSRIQVYLQNNDGWAVCGFDAE